MAEQTAIAAIECRVIELERELRTLRGALAELTRCTCPIGFGAIADPGCPKHGSRSAPEQSDSWLVSQDPSSGYPDAIPLALSEDELVELQEALGGIHEPLRLKLRAFQMAAFVKAHG